ncbi:MAG: response regulator, partial [Chloroflexi bacterium]|nr:response regulator [Chloroflexota bacterium]
SGARAMGLGRKIIPSLILLDVGLPDTDGYTLFKEFRAVTRLRYTPIIFVTKRSRREERLAGLELGADDYIHKPFDLEELFLRVQNAINRAARESLADPRTGLPSAIIVRQELALLPEGGARRALKFRLRNLDPFLDRYGLLAVSNVLRHTALLLNGVVDEFGDPEDFLGQSGDDSFSVICAGGKAAEIRRAAVDRFNADVNRHYAMAQATPDGVRVTDAGGHTQLLPIMWLETVELGG